MVGEIVSEILREVATDPVRFALEVAQFAILVGIAYVVMFGFGSRRGMLVNMLAERRRRVADRVERAAGADARLAEAREVASSTARASRDEAAAILRHARAEASADSARARAAADADAAALRAHAASVLEEERSELGTEMRDRLIGVVAQATRGLLSVSMTPQQQRELIQRLVADRVDGLERSIAERPPAGARR